MYRIDNNNNSSINTITLYNTLEFTRRVHKPECAIFDVRACITNYLSKAMEGVP